MLYIRLSVFGLTTLSHSPLLLLACYPKTFYPLLQVCDVIKECLMNCILLFPGRSDVFQEVTLTALTTQSWKSFIDEETQRRTLTEYSHSSS